MNIYQLFKRGFAAERVFLETETGITLTYGELDAQVARYAAWLRQLGLARGERVLAQIDKSVEGVFLYLAVLRSGLVFVPLNPAYQRGELEYFLADAEPALVVCRPQTHAMLAELAAARAIAHVYTLGDDGSGSLLAALPGNAASIDAHSAADELAVILYTSGTTGRSKGAMLTHRNLIANAQTLVELWDMRAQDVLLHTLPTFHIHGLFVALHTALIAGMRVIFLPRFDAKQVLQLLPRSTVFMGVPTYYTRLLGEAGLNESACANMRLFISGSAPLLEETFTQFQARTGHTILERYGMSETGMNTSNPLHGERKPGTVGPPLPGVQLRVVDEQDRPLPAEAIGNIQVRGDNVFAGYWRKPEKNQEEFTADTYFRTGDVGKLGSDGYLSIVGRSKDLIISGGLNVYPKEVESYIDQLPGVVESAVVGVPHPDFGEAVVAVVIQRGDALQEAGVIQTLKPLLANFKVPKRVMFEADLPRNAMGKVQKNVLRERYAKLFL